MVRNRTLWHWLKAHRVQLAFLALLVVLATLRGYWTPDEPDFAQSIKEMRWRGTWLFPWLNGELYTEKPILFYWLMKAAAIGAERLSHGLGFARGIAPWALRLPSIIAATALLCATRIWARRFLDALSAERITLILATTPIWLWQGQFIQIDMVFAALLAWAWMSAMAGYSLLRGLVWQRTAGEARGWFLGGYAALGLAVLAKGPLALVLTAAVMAAFLTWQRDWKAVRQMALLPGLGLLAAIVLPWYLLAAIKGGPDYFYAMVVHQNFARALNAWDHVQPWWRYLSYLAADFFPWSLALPVAAVAAFRQRDRLRPVQRFALLAWVVPLLLLSLSKSKQGKYLLMVYPFLAMTVATQLPRLAPPALRTLRRVFGLALAIPGAALLLVSGAGLGGAKLLAKVGPFLGPLRLAGLILLLGGCWVWRQARVADDRSLIWRTAISLGLMFALVLPWGFVRLNPGKDYQRWARQTEPLLAYHQVYFWGGIRSGAMIYSDRLLPVLASPEQLLALGPDDRLIATERQWKPGLRGLRPELLSKFEVLYRQRQGGDGLLILVPRGAPGMQPLPPLEGDTFVGFLGGNE